MNNATTSDREAFVTAIVMPYRAVLTLTWDRVRMSIGDEYDARRWPLSARALARFKAAFDRRVKENREDERFAQAAYIKAARGIS